MAFPTFWQLIFPNLNGFTFWGIIVLAVSILAFIYLPIFKKESLLGVISGLVLIFVPSAISDVLVSPEGRVTFFGIIFGALVLYYVVINQSKTRRRR